jgi:hypothetical protein
MTDLSGRKPILALDFDGVCHSYTSGWKGATVIPDPPVDGMWDFIAAAVMYFEVNVWSSRSNQDGGIAAMREWFFTHARGAGDRANILELQFPTEKPPAFVGIDDRVITFTGTWPDAAELLNFKTWNAKGV